MVPGDPELEELRRRVYGPGATDVDRAEYRRLRNAVEQPSAPMDEAPGTGAPTSAPRCRGGPRGSRLLLIGAVAVAVVAAIGALLPRPAPLAPAPAPTPVSVDPAIRDAFLRNLAAGRAAGIGNYLRSERFETPLRDATHYALVERRGTGPGSVRIRPEEDFPAAGRATVILIVRASGHVGWALSALPYLHADEGSNLLAERGGDAEAGTPSFASVRYHATTMPVKLRVDVPDGVAWGAAVVLSDR